MNQFFKKLIIKKNLIILLSKMKKFIDDVIYLAKNNVIEKIILGIKSMVLKI